MKQNLKLISVSEMWAELFVLNSAKSTARLSELFRISQSQSVSCTRTPKVGFKQAHVDAASLAWAIDP